MAKRAPKYASPKKGKKKAVEPLFAPLSLLRPPQRSPTYLRPRVYTRITQSYLRSNPSRFPDASFRLPTPRRLSPRLQLRAPQASPLTYYTADK